MDAHKFLLSCLLWIPLGCAAGRIDQAATSIQSSTELENALTLAGKNRAELELVLQHYREGDDPLKLKAAEFLIANMPGQGYGLLAYYDRDGNEIPFDIADYKNYKEAKAAFQAQEKEHGEINYKKKEFLPDLEVITADYLIENIDLAFKAWREKPWAKNLPFVTFCEHVLPYRESNEPINRWRRPWMFRLMDLEKTLENPADPKAVSAAAWKDINSWITFDEIYYLHPTDQGFDEMTRTRMGRCEDLANLAAYALRSQAVASASDYTPFWADANNNHAWQVILDENGEARETTVSRAAKIYRKTYSIQPANLAFKRRKGEKVPRWLSGKFYKDVTTQYFDTTDVSITLPNKVPDGERFAYICVFNTGKWNPIHWAEIKSHGSVTFTTMGRNIAYLPAYFVDGEILPAGPPFILSKRGQMRRLLPNRNKVMEVEFTTTKPDQVHADTLEVKPSLHVESGKRYELFVWDEGGWQTLGKTEASGTPVTFSNIPAGALFWLVEEESQRLERIFTIEDGKQVWW